MSVDNDGGPAFPVSRDIEADYSASGWGSVGMTLRDYFAAKAMQGEMANPNVSQDAKNRAAWAYEVADAMLAARGAA